MPFDEIKAAWKAGRSIQYLVTNGYDDDWTDYTTKAEPQEQQGRLRWRVKPDADGVSETRKQDL